MNSIETRCEMLDKEIDELKVEILGEYVSNEEEGKLNNLIDIAMMLGEAYVYRDSIVTPKVKTEEAFNQG